MPPEFSPAPPPAPLPPPEPRVPAVPSAGAATWQDFEICARKLAVICKQLRITTFEIDTPLDGPQKVNFEQNNNGEVRL